MELLTPKDIASILSMSPRSARKFLERNGVFPINVGNGSIPRLRWTRDAVISLIDTLQADTNKHYDRKSIQKVRKKYSESFFDLPVHDILDIIAQPVQ